MIGATRRQRVKLNDTGRANEVMQIYVERSGFTGEGTLIGERYPNGFYWVEFDLTDGTTCGLNVLEEEFDVIEEAYETVTLRLDSETLAKVEDVFMDSFSYAELRAALKALDVTK